jgi:diketogulonate reductase-like aldo/keto reductase
VVTTAVPTVALPSGELIPVLGQGTWHLAEDPWGRHDQIDALRLGLDLGMTLVDTAEMYADGGAEELVGEAIAGRRDEVFLVSKVLPHHATVLGTVAACEASLRRLRTDRLDLYLLHWRGRVPLAETVEGFTRLREAGLIRHWGVSNFDVSDLEELLGVAGGRDVETDQVLYNLARRGIEWDLAPRCAELGLPIMAYSPIEQGRVLRHPTLLAVARRHDATPAQIALAWVLRHGDVNAIPRSRKAAHVRENRAALDVHLTEVDLADLDAAFPTADGPGPLEAL